MTKYLVIVESPGKIKKIQSFLGPEYTVKASVGHVQDLDANSLSIDILQQQSGDYTFIPKYSVLEAKRKTVSVLKKARSEFDEVIIASDEDREGEFIGYSVSELLSLKKPKRIVFNEITKNAIQNALANPRLLNENLIDAQKTRRMLDRLIGYKIRPLLGSGLSAGRVQSVVVRLIIDKENEIKEQLSNLTSSYEIEGTFDGSFKAKLNKHPDLQLDMVESELRFLKATSPYYVESIKNNERFRQPPPPFITSSLQQIASSSLSMSIQTTMATAQKLYESGYITYMRTDSTAISPEFSYKIADYIKAEFGTDYYQYRTFKNKANSQEAHECIRPTDIKLCELSECTESETKLYRMIWQRTVASQMSAAIYSDQTVKLNKKCNKFQPRYWIAKASQLKFDGFLKVYNYEVEETTNLLELKEGLELTLKSIKATESFHYSNSRYNEASLVKKMEAVEIGRPSTYVSTLKTIQDRGYVTISDAVGVEKETTEFALTGNTLKTKNKITKIGFEKKRFIPTETGYKLDEFLRKNFPDILEVSFTADLEKQLDEIAEGKKKCQIVLNEFYKPFLATLNKVSHIKQEDNKKNFIGTDQHGHEYYEYNGKYGLTVKKIYTPEKVAQFFPVQNKDISLEDAIKISSSSELLGMHRKKPIFRIIGKYGPYLKYGDKNISLKTDKEISFEAAKKLVSLDK